MPNGKEKEIVFLLGSGGREHTLDRTILKSPHVKNVYVAPGNGGIPQERRIFIDIGSHSAILNAAKSINATLVLPGPEQSVVDGLGNYIATYAPDIKFFGPSSFAAQLEGSKIFTKTRCVQWDIPTADFDIAGDYKVAERIIKERGFWVVKADGLCAGKGVVVADSEKEALEAAHQMLVGKIHGKAGSRILLEERLVGPECSAMFICDGEHAVALAPARDYKRVYDGNKGPNTGGMGAYSPLPDVDDALLLQIKERIIMPTLRGMKSWGHPFKGLLYAGLMLTKEGPKLIEYNVRFGDPETQVVLPRLQSDLVPYLLGACTGQLGQLPPLSFAPGYALGVTMTSGGYPGDYKKGFPIRGLDKVRTLPNVAIFEAGTREVTPGEKETFGGRVLNVVGHGPDLHTAKVNAYGAVEQIHWLGEYHRTDIGN